MAITTPTLTLPNRIAGAARSKTPLSGFARGETLRRDDRIDPNQSIQTLRFGQNASATMRSLSEVDGLVSAVNVNYIATATTDYQINAYTTWTNEFSREGLLAAETIISGMDTLWNYTKGYQDKRSITTTSQTAMLEVMLTGGVAGELVLDQNKFPSHVALFPYDSIIWKSDGKGGRYPAQTTSGEEIELNYPNVFVSEMLKSADRLYALPMTHSGVKQLIQYTGFLEDMQRVLRRNGQPRVLAKLDYEKVLNSAPPTIRNDPQKLSTYLDQVRSDVEILLSSVEPEDAIVFYDVAEIESMSSDGEKRDYKELLSELSGLSASALKSNPSALGLRVAGGSQNIASTEAMLSMKIARLIQLPVEELFSRALTLAVRLYGIDCYIKFKFREIDLRPKAELEAHLAIRQNRVLELLSLGRITDDEAQTMLDLTSLPETAEDLSGTGFYGAKAPDTVPASGTNSRNNQISPDGPNSSGGKDNEERP